MRNAEVIRQWSILRDLESSRRVTIDELAERTGVTQRTLRFYEERGLLKAPSRLEGGFRLD